jgi:hypothetical protein
LLKIDVEIKCGVMNTTTKEIRNFSASKNFSMKTFSNSNSVTEYHLRMTKSGEYELNVLGKNGEPKPLSPEDVRFQHQYDGNLSQSLTTDEHGKLYLGKLDQVLTIQTSTGRSWRLPSLTDDWSYPGQIDIVHGDKVLLPIHPQWDMKKNRTDFKQINLIRSKNGTVLEDCTKKIAIVKEEGQNKQGQRY